MRILTGLQPSGALHIGNYFGAIQPAIELQDQGDAYYFIADYHAMTSTQDPKALSENVQNLAIDFLACGLDPEKSVFFKQSSIPEVHELAWILSAVCPMGLLERCHSYKDKVARGISANHGLFAYPVLMAADILLYDAELVPVGEDQKQHLEVTRDLVGKIHEIYGDGILTMPEPRIRSEIAKVPGIDGQKMSKSYNNTIPMFGATKACRKTVMKIVTDTSAVEDPKPVEGSTIIALYKLFASEPEVATMIQDFEAGGIGYGEFKKRLHEAYWDHFAPMRERKAILEKDPAQIHAILNQGAEKARVKANEVLTRVRKATGLFV